MIQSRENGQKLQFEQFFDDFLGQISPNFKFFWKMGLFKLKVIFSTNFRAKTEKIVRAVFEKNISDWFWANLETFSRISPRIFSKIQLSLFYLYSPLNSRKKSEKSLEPFLRKLRYQPTNYYYQQHRS